MAGTSFVYISPYILCTMLTNNIEVDVFGGGHITVKEVDLTCIHTLI